MFYVNSFIFLEFKLNFEKNLMLKEKKWLRFFFLEMYHRKIFK